MTVRISRRLILALALAACTEPPKPPVLTMIAVTSEDGATSIMLGETLQLAAEAKDQKGSTLSPAPAFSWTTTNASVATVDANGLVAATGGGQATITATSGTVSGGFSLTVAGSIHSTDITTNQTWRAADNPHFVTALLDIDGVAAPVLTIEAGVEIRFRSGTGLAIADFDAGSIQANGTASAPITMIADATSPPKGFWTGLYIGRRAGPSALHFVTMSHCGSASAGTSGCIHVDANAPSQVPQVLIDHVTIQNSSTHGFISTSQAGFATGSAQLTVTGSELDPIRLHANVAGTIPTGGTFTGNTRNVVSFSGDGRVSISQTWPSLGIPYAPDAFINIEGTDGPTLTLLPGTEIRMASDRDFSVGTCGAGGAGSLVASGTAAAPITFTANTATPTAGFWGILHFECSATSASLLDHVIVEYGGAGTSIVIDGAFIHGNIGFSFDLGPMMTNTTSRFSADCGVIRDDREAWSTDFTAPALNNTFTDNPQAQCGP